MTNPLGLYLHIPFCNGKCAYCDFYSVFPSEKLLDEYTQALIREIKQWGGSINRPIDTIYLGGGTPSLLNHRLVDIISSIKNSFKVVDHAELTLEVNPAKNIEEILKWAKTAGVNRLSIGAQSGDDGDLSLLGRKHTHKDTEHAVKTARDLGFDNISLDLILGLPFSTKESLDKSLKFIWNLKPEHISAYILKIEPNTLFFKKQKELSIPDDDNIAEQYLQMCGFFKDVGYKHYEISNFAKQGFESQHNLKYWDLKDYLGIGPAAHSAVDGNRFFYPRDIKAFINGNTPIPDGECGNAEEYIMLSLRTSKGVSLSKLEKDYCIMPNNNFLNLCDAFEKNGYLIRENNRIALTDEGMLLSNSIITKLLENF